MHLSGTATLALFLIPIGIHLSAIPQQKSPTAPDVTFSKDVAPIAFEHCVYCHRAGNIGPFSMTTYSAVRPWARSIRQAVLTRRMPPWFVEPSYEKFLHERRLSDRDVRTIVAWVDGGAKEGNRADMPALPQFADGWQIGTPDLIVTMSESYKVPATGAVPVVSLPTDYVFPEDTWVQAIEVRPGNRSVVHQALARVGSGGIADGLNLYSSGLGATRFRDGYGKFIPKGTRVHLQIHYNTTGRATTDRTQVGFKFAVKPVHTEVRTGIAEANTQPTPLLLETHQQTSTFPLLANARLHAFRLHMSVRGGNVAATLVLPNGSRKVLLAAAGWGDDWEYDYVLAKPEAVPSGAVMEYTATYEGPTQNVPKETHVLYFEWTEVNEANRNDLEPIGIPANPLFTTGLRGSGR
jgi:hypothetical protein